MISEQNETCTLIIGIFTWFIFENEMKALARTKKGILQPWLGGSAPSAPSCAPKKLLVHFLLRALGYGFNLQSGCV